jgi:hypothetical protein
MNPNYILTIVNKINWIVLMVSLIYIAVNPSNCWLEIYYCSIF